MADFADRLNAALAGRYAIQRKLGRGGMGTVFLAQDLKQPRHVAIKVLLPEVAAAIGAERFLREIGLAAGLSHPHIMPLLESGSADGLFYFVMPYAEGESLRQRLEREKQLPLEDALRIASEMAGALDFAHRRGIVHRDIKPENILLADGHAVLSDFGIARAIQAAGGEKLTATGVSIGTPAYMSPEQAVGSRELDGRCDVYALGCVVYEMLAGNPPFAGPIAWAIQARHAFDPVPPLRTVRPAVPDAIERAVTKALAKLPADRHATAAEFAAAIATSESPAGAERVRRRAMVAIGAALAIAGVWIGWKLLHPPDPGGTGKRDWILVAEFDGPADDPGLTAAARELVTAGLDQSKVVASVPRQQIREALRLAGRPDTTRVDARIARELAYRRNVRAVVEGHIGRLGRGYSIVLRVTDAEDGTTLLSVSDAAKRDDDLIPAFGRLTRRLRDRLGDRNSDVRATRERIEVATPSFEAYRKYTRAWELQNEESNDRGSIVECREALAIDPDFAAAWMLMGWGFNHLGQIDSSRAALEEALRRPERLTEVGRLFGESTVAVYKNDLPAGLAAHDRLVREYPSPSAYSDRGVVFACMGRYEDALGDQERAVALEAFVPRQWILTNQFEYLVVLGRLPEAAEVATRLKGARARLAGLGLAIPGAEWARAESCATALLDDPTADRGVRAPATFALASEKAARGEIAASRRLLGETRKIADLSNEAARAELLLQIAGGEVPHAPDAAMARDTSCAGEITQGWWAAVGGDVPGARRLLARVRARPAVELARHGAGPALLEAWIAARSDQWQEAVGIIGPAARQGFEVGFVDDGIGRVPMRWLMGEAWERLGRPDSAAAYFELALSPERMFWEERPPVRMVSSYAHRRLVLLYARMGRLEDARRHWLILAETVRSPDPELRPMMEEARVALASAEAMARSARP